MATPLCPYFGTCGGCTAQHIDYATQLENKKNALKQLLNASDIQVFSGSEYFYRNRMDFIFHPGGLGLRKKGQWDKIIDIEHCVIAEKRINELMKEVRAFFKDADIFDIKKHRGTFRYALIRCTASEASISFVLNEESSQLSTAIEQIRAFAPQSSAENICITYVPPQSDQSISGEFFSIKGKDTLQTTFLGKTFQYSVQAFFQNNHFLAEKMQEYCHERLKRYDTKDASLLDLYGGVGSFGIVNAELFKHVTIVDSVKESIDAAQKNIVANKITNTEALLLDAKQIKKINLKQPLFVITDPPRAGMDQKTIQALNEQKPQVILYISCNPQQLAKDLQKVKAYKIKSVALFDLFPQTPHSEAVVELIREGEGKNTHTAPMGQEIAAGIKSFCASMGIHPVYLEHEAVITSEEAAKTRGFALKQGIKALLFTNDNDQWVIVDLPADKKVDPKKVAKACGWSKNRIRMASPEEVLQKTGCEIGAVPPFGHKEQIPILLDRGVYDNEENAFNIGLRTESMKIKTEDMKKLFEKIQAREGGFTKL